MREKKQGLRIALVGATGLVGQTMARVLWERGYGDCELIAAASDRSVGKVFSYGARGVRLVGLEEALAACPTIALFAAGGAVSSEWAPRFAESGVRVIDNSSAWRMAGGVPLIVPEVNPEALGRHDYIVANPNCSTIQLMVAMAPLHRFFELASMHISTYQSVSGSGMRGIGQLEAERAGRRAENPAYGHPIDLNCIPQCDAFLENGYTKEEMKLVNESRKILGLPMLRVSATAVRVPVWGGHSESVSALFRKPVDAARAREVLASEGAIRLLDSPAEGVYPLPLQVQGHDTVWVGRVREDLVNPGYGLNLWVVADNIRKGAATNAVQIMDLLVDRGWV